MKEFKINIQDKEISIFQDDDGFFIKPEIVIELEKQGTAIKPAHEPICMARKPLAEKTVARNVLKYGTGGINIDESRVESGKEVLGRKEGTPCDNVYELGINKNRENRFIDNSTGLGRFPANLIHDNSKEVRDCFPETKSGNLLSGHKRGDGTGNSLMGGGGIIERNYGGDSGNASRFFKSIIYQAKASKKDRGSGNNHPTVKPIKLTEYLINMVSTKDSVILDPFMGSGTTGVACQNTGRNFIGIELDEKYFKIAEERINNNE